MSHEPGGPETLRLEDVADPVPGPGELLVRVAAVSLNFPDALIIADKYQFKPPRPFVPGSELAGVVVAVGEGVSTHRPGDRIAAVTGHGGLAELAVVPAWKAVTIPAGVALASAAVLGMVYGTVLHGLTDRARLEPGETLLVLGAAGGIGLAAVELGRLMGARVVAGVSSPEKAQAARAAGADEVIVYPRAPFDAATARALAARFKAAAPEGFDVVFDPVGGDYAEPALRAIAWEGRYLVVGFTAGIPRIALNLPLLKAASIIGIYWGHWSQRHPARFQAEMAQLLDWLAQGRLRPAIAAHHAFAEAPDAIARMTARSVVGKLVVTVDPGVG